MFKSLGSTLRISNILKFLSSASSQESIDTYRAALALKCYLVCQREGDGSSPSLKDVDKFVQEVDSMHFSQQGKFVQENINDQLVRMFNALEDLEVVTAGTAGLQKTNYLREIVKFTLKCDESTIVGAGQGLFIETNGKTSIPTGSVVGIFPGLVHLKEHLKMPDYFSKLLPDEDFMLMTRMDECLIDARSAHLTPSNPYGLAHMINHCGFENRPNVMQVTFDFPEDFLAKGGFPRELRKYIPNQYAQQPSFLGSLEFGSFSCMKSAVVVATKHLEDGEELLMDYRLPVPVDPLAATLPAWYAPYDMEDSRNRWDNE